MPPKRRADHKDRIKKQNNCHKLRRAKEKFSRFVKWLEPEQWFFAEIVQQDLILRAFKTFIDGTAQFFSFWEWAGDYIIERSLPLDENKDSSFNLLDFRQKTQTRYNERFEKLSVLDVDEYPEVALLVRKLTSNSNVFVDPILNDLFFKDLWHLVVLEEHRNYIQFRNTAGDGWIFDVHEQLWRAVDVKQMQVHILETFNRSIKRENCVLFTTDKQQNYWETKIGDLTTFTGLINLLKGRCRYPNPFEQKLDKKEWLIPLKNAKVYDVILGKVRQRTMDDCFTTEVAFSYLSDYLNENATVINDSKIQLSFNELLCNKSLDQKKIITCLEQLCPNAMKLVEGSFTEPSRLWFLILRLGILLSGFCTREILFVYGKGKGGKSTLFQTIADVCGDLGIILQKASFLRNKMDSGSSHKTDLKRASGRRVCLVDELESSDVLNETLLKNWASHQKIPMREIYGKQGEEQMKSFVVFVTNEPPRFSQEDPTIRERIRAVKCTTKYFDGECPKAERPLAYSGDDTWIDGYSESEDTYWIRRTSEKEEFYRSFKDKEEMKNELGTLLCLATQLAYHVLEKGRRTQLPFPSKVQEDSLAFFQESDVIECFLNEYYEEETDYYDAVSLKEMYEKFRFTFPELGIKSFTLQTFKRSLSGKNLLFATNKHALIKVKKKLKGSGMQYIVQ